MAEYLKYSNLTFTTSWSQKLETSNIKTQFWSVDCIFFFFFISFFWFEHKIKVWKQAIIWFLCWIHDWIMTKQQIIFSYFPFFESWFNMKQTNDADQQKRSGLDLLQLLPMTSLLWKKLYCLSWFCSRCGTLNVLLHKKIIIIAYLGKFLYFNFISSAFLFSFLYPLYTFHVCVTKLSWCRLETKSFV